MISTIWLHQLSKWGLLFTNSDKEYAENFDATIGAQVCYTYNALEPFEAKN